MKTQPESHIMAQNFCLRRVFLPVWLKDNFSVKIIPREIKITKERTNAKKKNEKNIKKKISGTTINLSINEINVWIRCCVCACVCDGK